MEPMKLSWRPAGSGQLAMPLWLQGVFEFLQCAVLSALAVAVPLLAVWLADGFANTSFDALARLAGQTWLKIHGVPLHYTVEIGASEAGNLSGTLSLIPLALTLIPFFLSWRAGRRLAQAAYTGPLWQALLCAMLTYAAFGALTAWFVSTPEVRIESLPAALIPLIPAGLGLAVGARRGSGSWARLIGVDAAKWISRTSQHSRWAGSYVWSAVRAGAVAVAAVMALSALLFAVDLALHWADISNIYQRLNAGVVGGTVLTIAQLGLLPNFAVWTMAWTAGPGFAIGTGSVISPLQTTVGPLPAVPVLGALPTGDLEWGALALLLPVCAGLAAGWWFLREGENHFDEWLSIKLKARWFTLAASTLVLGMFIGAIAGLISLVLTTAAGGSVGIGRLVEIGPEPLPTALALAAEVAIGVVVGYLAAPWLEREPDAGDTPPR